MYERILVPTDGSVGVERAVEHALDLAAAHGATVHAVYVVNSASFASLPMETSWDGLTDVLRAEGEAALDRVRKLGAEQGVHVEGVVRDGSPSQEIVMHANAVGADIIVMGTHGRGGIDRLLLGSVAERVVRSSPIPVLTVQVSDSGKPDEGIDLDQTTEPAADAESDA